MPLRDSSSYVHSWLAYVNAMRLASMALVLAACGGENGGNASAIDAGRADGSGSGSGSGNDAATGTAQSCTGMTAQPLDSEWTITVGSLQRKARVHVPTSYDPIARTPVVINIHGRTGWAQQQANLSRAIAKSDAEGFIVIHPEGTGSPTAWNAGGGCCDPAAANNVDDSGFISQLIDEAAARLCVDADRVYVMGLSNGGYLAHRLACEHADKIAAIGPVAGVISMPTCNPTRPMPMMIVHGTADSIVQYSWEAQTVNFWKVTNGCTTEAVTFTNGAASCVTHGGCTDGADVVMCTLDGVGHQWPGGESLPFLGANSNDLVATDAIWDFFVAHPRR